MSLHDQTTESGLADAFPLAFDMGEDLRVAMRDPKGMLFGEGVEVEGWGEYLGTLMERHNGCVLVEYGDGEAWRSGRVTYVVGTEDRMVTPERQRMMVDTVRKEGVDVNVVEMRIGHCPNWTAVGEVVEVVRGLEVGGSE